LSRSWPYDVRTASFGLPQGSFAGEINDSANPRHLIAIKIEFNGSLKLILGGFTNGSTMRAAGFPKLRCWTPDIHLSEQQQARQ